MKPAKFKMTELGPIPSDWEVKRLGEIANIQLGKMIDEEKNIGVEKSYLSNRDVHWGQIDVSQLHKVKMTDADLGKYDLKDGDLLVCEGGEVGRAAIWHAPIQDCYFQKTLHRVRLNEKVGLLTAFLLAILHRYADVGFFDAYVAKTSIAHLPKDKFELLPIPLPPLPEQRRIAAALSDVDELIGALGKLVEKKRAIKTGAMQRLLTGQTRLPGFGGAEFKQTELGPIPSDWEVKRLGETFSMLRNNTYARESLTDDGGKVFNVHYGDILVKYGAKVNFEMDEVPCLKAGIKPNKDMLQDGDLIFADTAEDEMVGKAVEVAGVNGRQAVAGLHTILCRPYSDTFAHGFLGYFVNSAAYHNQLLPLITGTKVSSVSRAGFASTYVCIPSLPEQRAIAAVLSDMDAEIAALEAEQAKYTRIKSGMMQELLTGRTRLI